MKEPKVWLILGATEGLGPAAVKYLLANRQLVIPVDTSVDTPIAEVLAGFAVGYGQIDFIINNSNYYLFNEIDPDIGSSITATMDLLNSLTPCLRQAPRGTIINIPPQLCLATLQDKTTGEKLLTAMDTFLATLHQNLLTLNCSLRFLEPGERLLDL